jgi:hypothetical protein
MRQFRNIMRSRAVPILTGAVVAILVLPAAALAGGFSAPNGRYHGTGTGSGGSAGLVILLAVIAVGVLSVVILSWAAERKSAPRPAKSIQRSKPAGIAS